MHRARRGPVTEEARTGSGGSRTAASTKWSVSEVRFDLRPSSSRRIARVQLVLRTGEKRIEVSVQLRSARKVAHRRRRVPAARGGRKLCRRGTAQGSRNETSRSFRAIIADNRWATHTPQGPAVAGGPWSWRRGSDSTSPALAPPYNATVAEGTLRFSRRGREHARRLQGRGAGKILHEYRRGERAN